MSRRAIILFFLGGGGGIERIKGETKTGRLPDAAPDDILRLNGFAVKYDEFVAKFNAGVADVKLWEEVCKRGQKLFGGCRD